MGALRLCAIGFLLMPIAVGAEATWNSTDMSLKATADKSNQIQIQSELANITAHLNHVTSLLKENQNILDIAKKELRHATSGNLNMANQIKAEKGKLQHAEQALAKQKGVLEAADHRANETAEALRNAEHELSEAQADATAKRAALNAALAQLHTAEEYLQQMVICCPEKVEAAKKKSEDWQAAVDATRQALGKAQKAAADAQDAVDKAQDAADKAAKAAKATQPAYQEDVGRKTSAESYLKELEAKAADPQKVVAALTNSVEKQEKVVKHWTDEASEYKKLVAAKKDEYSAISGVVKKSVECISRLQIGEGVLETYISETNFSTVAYQAVPDGPVRKSLAPALWQLKDKQAEAENSLHNIQKDCAPPNIKLGTPPPLPSCSNETGGSCKYFGCWYSRGPQVYCSQDYTCMCSPGTCAVEGVCVDRGAPVLLASPPAELRAGAVAASAAFLAAATLATVKARRWRRHPSDSYVRMPK